MNKYLVAIADYMQIGENTFQMNGIHTKVVSAQKPKEVFELFDSVKPYKTVLAISLLEEECGLNQEEIVDEKE